MEIVNNDPIPHRSSKILRNTEVKQMEYGNSSLSNIIAKFKYIPTHTNSFLEVYSHKHMSWRVRDELGLLIRI